MTPSTVSLAACSIELTLGDLIYSFADFSTIFNGNVKTAAQAVICPLDAEDVSK